MMQPKKTQPVFDTPVTDFQRKVRKNCSYLMPIWFPIREMTRAEKFFGPENYRVVKVAGYNSNINCRIDFDLFFVFDAWLLR